MQPGRNPLIERNGPSSTASSLPGRRPDTVSEKISSGLNSTKSFISTTSSKVASSDAYAKVKTGAGVAWDKTKDVSVAAAHASKPALIAAKNGAANLFEKTKNAISGKK